MRLVRLGQEPSKVGVDVRAALATFGAGDGILGGVALIGYRPAGSSQALDAVVVLPQGVLLVVGVDLPEPTMRLEAPLDAQWRMDGTPLVPADGAINPAAEAQRIASVVIRQLRTMRAEPPPVTTVLAVGPYVGHVLAPAADLHRGVRVLHPTPTTLLSAARELASRERSCSAEQASRIVAALAQNAFPRPDELIVEGFANAASSDLAGHSTARTRATAGNPPQASAPNPAGTARAARQVPGHTGTAGSAGRWPARPRWLASGTAGLVAAVVLAGILTTVASAGDDQPTTTAASSPSPHSRTFSVDGVSLTAMGSARDADCVAHSYGSVRGWLGHRPCHGLSRQAFAVDAAPHQAVVTTATVDMPDPVAAEQFQHLVDTPGSGGITDLVHDGHGWSGGPKSFDGAAYASARHGTSIEVVEVAWIGQSSRPDDPGLLRLVQTGLRLPAAR